MSVYRQSREPTSGALRFDDLAPDTRALLTASCRGHAPPVPLLRGSLGPRGRPWAYLAMAALLLAAAVGVFFAGTGSLYEAMPPAGMVPLIELLVTLAGALATIGMLTWWGRGGLPFPHGNYLFARDLVMAHHGRLTLIPTRSLTFVQPTPHCLEVLGPGDSRKRIAFFACQREGMVDELLLEREALERAEQAGDMAARLRLDPFCGERSGWSESVHGELPHMRWFERFPGGLVWLVGCLAVSQVATPLLTERAIHAVKTHQIEQAEATGDQGRLTSFLAPAHELPASLREAAEGALFRMAMRSGNHGDLLAYLKRGGPHAIEVTEEFHRRFCQNPSSDSCDDLARWGRGPTRDRTDALVFQRAVEAKSSWPLYGYAEYGSRRDEVRRSILPRRELDEELRRNDLGALRGLKARWDHQVTSSESARSLPPPEMQQELAQAIDTLIDQHRVHLRERTGLRTSLARAVHQQLGKNLFLAPALVANSHVFTETRVALEGVITTYVPRSLLELEKVDEPLPYHSPTFHGPPTIVLDLEPLMPCRQLPCRRRLQLVFHDFGDTGLATQVITFTEPARDSGRTFEMAVTEALTGALLGDAKP